MIEISSPFRRILLVAAVVVTGAAAIAGAGTDVKINSDVAGTVQNEIRITQNATDANNFVVAYNDNAGTSPSPLGVSYSLDGGASWTDLQLGTPTHPLSMPPTPDDGIALSFIFDPFIDSDSQGNIYAGYIAAMIAVEITHIGSVVHPVVGGCVE